MSGVVEYETTMKACLIKRLSTRVTFLTFLIMIETRDDAGDNKSSFLSDGKSRREPIDSRRIG